MNQMTSQMWTHADYFMAALCVWREARGEGLAGMTAVAWVIYNRMRRHGSTAYAEVVRPWQFSSITAKCDPQLNLYPAALDPQWKAAQAIVQLVLEGAAPQPDPTQGSTLYHDHSIPFPAAWNRAKCAATVQLGNFSFYKELA